MATDKSNTKSDRRKCWDARDAYFKCDDEGKGEACEELRKKFLVLCPKVWVDHFQRKHAFEKYKKEFIESGEEIPAAQKSKPDIVFS